MWQKFGDDPGQRTPRLGSEKEERDITSKT